MDRMTEPNTHGTDYYCWNYCPGRRYAECRASIDLIPCAEWEIYNRLAEYENTGLEPEKLTIVRALCEDYVSAGLDVGFIRACINAAQSGMSAERITEITKAECEGRLIVLPSDPYEMADVAQEILSRACRLQREAEAALGGDGDGA